MGCWCDKFAYFTAISAYTLKYLPTKNYPEAWATVLFENIHVIIHESSWVTTYIEATHEMLWCKKQRGNHYDTEQLCSVDVTPSIRSKGEIISVSQATNAASLCTCALSPCISSLLLGKMSHYMLVFLTILFYSIFRGEHSASVHRFISASFPRLQILNITMWQTLKVCLQT